MNIAAERLIGTEWPVWWDTMDGRPGGDHMAEVLAVKPYTGPLTDIVSHILVLAAPGNKSGKAEMSVDLRDRADLMQAAT